MPASAETDAYAFSGCTGLKEVTIAGRKVEQAFDNCGNIETVRILEGIREIGPGTFRGLIKIREIRLPENLEKIGRETFRDCTGLETICLPEGLTEIGYSAFEGCTNLKSVTVPKSLESIGDRAFPANRELVLYGKNRAAKKYARKNKIRMMKKG